MAIDAKAHILVRPRTRDANEIGPGDAFSKGIQFLLKALTDEAPPTSRPVDAGSVTAAPKEQSDSRLDAVSIRLFLEIAAARFENPVISSVICMKPTSRAAFAV